MDFKSLLQNIKGLVTPSISSPIPGEGHVNPIQNAVGNIADKVGGFFEPKTSFHSETWGTPKPSPSPMPTAQPTMAPHRVLGVQSPQVTPNPAYSRPIPGGTDLAMNYIKSKTPRGQTPEEYYPALQDEEFMRGVEESDRIRQGVANLLLAQGFQESTLGRGSSNIFGVKPGGEVSSFESPEAALEYQLSKSVLGGGGNPNMNILNEGDNSPLTLERILKLYESYDPPGAYKENLKQIFAQ